MKFEEGTGEEIIKSVSCSCSEKNDSHKSGDWISMSSILRAEDGGSGGGGVFLVSSRGGEVGLSFKQELSVIRLLISFCKEVPMVACIIVHGIDG